MLKRIDNYLNERKYKITLNENMINIENYDEIINFTLTNISVKCSDKVINIDGANLTISKMFEKEVLITGNVTSIRINQLNKT